jgi:integrase
MPHLFLRNGTYYYNRRVPKRIKEFDPRSAIRISLNTDSFVEAERKSLVLHDELESYWQKLVASGDKHTEQAFHRAVNFARLLGFAYRTNKELSERSLKELVERHTIVRNAKDNKAHVEALLGGIPVPSTTVSNALTEFIETSTERILHKTPDQIRKWKNPRIKAINNFIDVVGDKALAELTRDDLLKFRDWWIERIKTSSVSVGSANKDLIHFKNIVETISDNNRLKLDLNSIFSKMTLKERFQKTREPFSRKEIFSILHSKKLDELNSDARWFLFAAAELGARPSEIVGLEPQDIILTGKIPHIRILDKPTRALKTAHSQRDLPLVGYALDAFVENPEGFARYRDKPDSLSNTVNKFLRENSLIKSDNQSVYSFRHSFQDRLVALDVPDRVQAELMGHKFARPNYGEGPTLQHKLHWLKKIQLKKPTTAK